MVATCVVLIVTRIADTHDLRKWSDALRDALLPIASIEHEAQASRLRLSLWTPEETVVIGLRQWFGPIGYRLIAGRRWNLCFDQVISVNLSTLPSANRSGVFELGNLTWHDGRIVIETYDGLQVSAQAVVLDGTITRTDDLSSRFTFRRMTIRFRWPNTSQIVHFHC
jgi:hypothetical protein